MTAGADDLPATGDDFTDLLLQFEGERAYSYLFDGQLGYLDYALANQTLRAQVTGSTVWHINADEPDLIDYDTEFKQDAQDAIYAPDQYRSSDHEAVIVGLALDQTPPVVMAELDRIAAPRTPGCSLSTSPAGQVDPTPDLRGRSQRGTRHRRSDHPSGQAPGKPITLRLGPVLFMKDDSFALTVTGTDERGNSATATAEPAFRR